MPVDPVTLTAAVTFFGKWMWDSYGQKFTDDLAKNLKGSRDRRSLESEWRRATETYVRKMYDQTNWLQLLGKREGMPLESIYTGVNVLDELSAEQFRQCGFPDEVEFAQKLLQKGGAIVLFDGLDEVNLEGEKRARLIRQIQGFVREFDQCSVLITCRIAARDYSFANFKYVEMADFTKVQQKTFIGKWFQDKVALRNACWAAMEADHNRTLVELAQVPLLLSLLCITFERRGEFPPDRDEVYRVAINALLFEWDSSRLIKRDALYKGLDVKYKERLLAWIAFETFEQGTFLLKETRLVYLIETYLKKVPRVKGEIDGLAVLKTIEAQHGLLVERVNGIYSFSHLTVQEYFTARYIVENEASGTLTQLMTHINEDQWREVILHSAGLLFDGTRFCDLFLNALGEMISKEKTILEMLHWAATQSASMQTAVHPAAARALWLFLILARARARELAHDRDLAHDREPVRALSLSRVLALNLAGDCAFDLARAFTRALGLDFGLSFDLALALALRFDLTLLQEITSDLEKNVVALRSWSRVADIPNWLEYKLELVPSHNDSDAFIMSVEHILLQLWELEEFWHLRDKQSTLLVQYLVGIQLLINCLDVATVDRAAIEARLLLPPNGA